MAVVISGVEEGSIAANLSVNPGETLVSIDGHRINDVLDYRFYLSSPVISVEISGAGGSRIFKIKKGEEEDLGLIFGSYLMDKQKSCNNRCIFCFIDQLPKGMRKSLYFKDDDSRLGFLFGNYITLTNLSQEDIDRIITMRISPVNISVHTTNPALRREMMGNEKAGDVLRWIPRLAGAGIRLNAQLVLCPGVNDGPYLKDSLQKLLDLAPAVQSIAVVQEGQTAHRQGLYPLRKFTREEANGILAYINLLGEQTLAKHGERVCYASDEFYLLAGQDIPPAAFYGPFDQLENGVVMLSLLQDEFEEALRCAKPSPLTRRIIIATGTAAAPFLQKMAGKAALRHPGLEINVAAIENDFFGKSITVAGLITGRDLIGRLLGKTEGYDGLLFPKVMLRREGDVFLDDLTPAHIQAALGIPVTPVKNCGQALLCAMLGRDNV